MLKFVKLKYFKNRIFSSLVKNMTEMLFPVVWFDEYLELDQDTRNQLKTVATIVKLTNAIPIAMIATGSGLALLSVSIVLFRYYKIVRILVVWV